MAGKSKNYNLGYDDGYNMGILMGKQIGFDEGYKAQKEASSYVYEKLCSDYDTQYDCLVSAIQALIQTNYGRVSPEEMQHILMNIAPGIENILDIYSLFVEEDSDYIDDNVRDDERDR